MARPKSNKITKQNTITRNAYMVLYKNDPEKVDGIKSAITKSMLCGVWNSQRLLELATENEMSIDLVAALARDCIGIIRHIRSGEVSADEYRAHIENIRQDCDLKIDRIYTEAISLGGDKGYKLALDAIDNRAKLFGLYHDEEDHSSPRASAHVINVFNQLRPDQIAELANTGSLTRDEDDLNDEAEDSEDPNTAE